MSANDNNNVREEGPRATMHDEHSGASEEDSLHELPSPADLQSPHTHSHLNHEHHQVSEAGQDEEHNHDRDAHAAVHPARSASTSPTRENASAALATSAENSPVHLNTPNPYPATQGRQGQSQQSHPPVALYTQHGTGAGRKRSGSSASVVPLDHFDPEGMHELRRTFTQQSRELRSQASLGQLGRQQSRPEIRFENADGGRKVSGGESEGTGTVVSDEEEDEREKFDFERRLKEVVTQANASNLIHRQLGVAFRDLTVTGLGASASFAPTVGSVFNPLLIPEKLREARHPATREILKGFEGVVWPGEMCLVLGRPGAGCSTLLKTLANQHGEYHSVTGFLHYANGISSSDVRNHFRGDVVYCEEDDVHFPTLTVEETLRFAARTKMPASSGRIARFAPQDEKASGKKSEQADPEKGEGAAQGQALEAVSKREFAEELVETLCTVFGLRHVRKTKVGNAAIRGVSGGERKRVSIAEALATRARLGCWDNSTRGLDSSTALEFVRALRLATDNLGLTSIVSIYQASELLYELFDKVALIHSGRLIYFGPADKAKDYFVRMGYEKNERTTTADYLVGVTDEIGRKIRAGYEGRVPRTVEEFGAYWEKSTECEAVRAEVDRFITEHVPLSERPPPRPKVTPSASKSKRHSKHLSILSAESYPSNFASTPPSPTHENTKRQNRQSYVQSAHAEHGKRSRRESPFVISIPRQIVEVMKRRVAIVKGDFGTQVIMTLSFIFQAIIMGTIFFNMADATSAYFSRGGILFFSVLFGALSAMAEIPALFAQRPIVSRHSKSAMYHPFTEAMALTLVDIPLTFITLTCFCIVVYFLAGLQRTAGQFFIFLLLVFTTTIMMKAFFRTLAAAFKREPGAQAIAGISVLILVLYTGYTIPKPTMIGALRWITYINPLRYAFEGILVNEFHTLDGSCSSLVPSGQGYENVTLSNQVCSTVGSVAGSSSVDGNTFVELSYGYAYSNLWRNFGIVVAFGIFFIGFLLCLSEFNTASALDVGSIMYVRSKKGREALTEEVEADPMLNVNSAATPKDEEKTAAPTPTQTGSGLSPARSNADKEQQEKALRDLVKTPDVFSWKDLEYTVPIGKGETRKLLDNISGYVSPGKLTALMGESGAGKTTLLNVLAGRTDTGVITGDRFVNGQGLPHDFQAQTGYCQQMDTHMPELTVRESLLFSAKLRQPQSVSLAEKEAYVETCLKMCGLEAQADAVVGSLGVEHRKRTTIGVELAAKPKLLLFLDEPTSGLDSQSAWAIMTFLRDLADHGQAILCTIHQPSNELFQVFDRLLLLKKGGQTVYFGDLGPDCKSLIEYFEANGGRKCDPHENPAEWMLDVIGAGATAQTNVDWREAWIRSAQAAAFRDELENIHNEGRKSPPVPAAQKSDFATPWFYQFYTNLSRLFTAYWRNPTYVMSKLFLNIAAGLFIGFTFFKAKDTIQGTQNKLFAIFMSTIVGVAAVNQLQIQWIDVRAIYEVRERPTRMYSWTALVASQIIVELPYNIFCNSLFFLCWFWTVGFPTDRAGYTYLMLSVLFPIYYTTIGQAVASMAPNALIASVLFSTLFSFVISFNGVLQPFRQLGWWKWMYHVSPFTYLIEGILGQAIGGLQVTCGSDEYVSVDPPSGQTCSQYLETFISTAGGYIANPDATSGCEYCSARTTDQFLQSSFNIFYSHHWRDCGIFAAFCVFNIFAIFAATYIFRIRKK